MDFKNITFKGKFRDYQQRVLDNSDKYLKDGKINIVAAPGSGKTVLGLELIRRLGSPCIVLSPTTAIRQQWGERFKDLFLDSEEDFPQLFSNDLHNVKLLNSITYQALYTAIEKISEEAEEDVDCSDVDIFAAMRQAKIKTVCLDEAHHLKNEWQKA
ncbi:MAG: DEAD/DEAH box helicase family protein, partial [Ruminiclostridium sp.]|nr:DEAD/DEAH box helicase family protein [Ruminiclostridium sp.]